MQIGAAVDLSWHLSNEGKELITSLRQPYGLLEKPLALRMNSYDIHEYKLLLYGRSCVGKSKFLSKLLNINNGYQNYCETPGIQISTLYWPVKMLSSESITIFKLNLWDVGDNALLRYDYLITICRENLDGLVYIFSFTDKASFMDVASKVSANDGVINKFVVGCKMDCRDVDVTISDVIDLEKSRNLKVFLSPQNQESNNLEEISAFLNGICSKLFLLKK